MAPLTSAIKFHNADQINMLTNMKKAGFGADALALLEKRSARATTPSKNILTPPVTYGKEELAPILEEKLASHKAGIANLLDMTV